jgi:CRISPR/Cas system-associated endonuclease Cas1
MESTGQSVTLTAAEVEELNQRLSTMRHDINNHLSLIVATAEMLRLRPQMAERMVTALVEQPPKISAAVGKFCEDFEKSLGVNRS